MLVVPLLLGLALAPRDSLHSREIRVATPDGQVIAAVIESAGNAGARPTVVLISGAGAHDRNGYTLVTARGHNDAFRTLSTRLVRLGYAVVRFDKVGTGSSTGDYRVHATTASHAAHVAAIVTAIRGAREVDPERITLVGHSEGGAIAGIVAADDPRIAGVALLAAPAWTGRRIMRYQLRYAAARRHRTVSYTSADLIEAYLVRDAAARVGTEAWYPYFLDYDPLPPMRRLRSPVLVLQGDRDEVVTAEQAVEIAEAITANGNAAVRFQVMPGYTHSFTNADRGAGPVAPLSEEIISLIEDWLLMMPQR